MGWSYDARPPTVEAMTEHHHTTGLSLLRRTQCGVATVKQLVDAGLSAHHVAAQVQARRWRRFGEHCVVTHNFEPTRLQWTWVALLDHPGPVAVAGLTALEVGGFRFFGRETELVHIAVPRGTTPRRLPGVKVHESRRFTAADIVVTRHLPHTPFPRSALDAGAWQPHPRYACGVLAAVVQQRLCTATELGEALGTVGRVRHKRQMRLALHDIAGGAEALSELDVAALCRRFGLRPPDRQRVRRDRQGRKRYLDCEWILPDGSVVVLEVDGAHHLEVTQWEADVKRERGVVVSGRAAGRTVLRATANEARYDQAELAADLRSIGVPTELSVG
jgi:hypothetical protein